MPSELDALRAKRRAAIAAAAEGKDDWRELTPVINVYAGQKPSSDPPGEALSVHGPGGLRLRKAPSWLILVLGLALILVGGVAGTVGYVLTH